MVATWVGRRGGQEVTAAPRQTVKSTTEVQTPDSVDESQLSESQRHDEGNTSDAQSDSSELVGANRSITAILAQL